MLVESPQIDPNQFYSPSLLGGSVEYDVDLTESNCGCVAAFYLTTSPGRDASGNFWNTDGYYYCDDHAVTGNYCPGFDLMEADQWVFVTNPHSCDPPTEEGFYTKCSFDGDDMLNTVDMLDYSAYGPGDSFTINTLKEYHVKHTFGYAGNFYVELTQDG